MSTTDSPTSIAFSHGTSSAAARERLLSRRGEPLFIADWERVLMAHFEVDPDQLQRAVPLQVDLRDGRAFVSVVAFTMRGMRPRLGGRIARWLIRPIATHHFLNVRTYVRHGSEVGIYFLAEWLSNWLAVWFGPATFGLPYRHGRIAYHHDWQQRNLRGHVSDGSGNGALAYSVPTNTAEPRACPPGTLDEWLMERYTAYTRANGMSRFFRVWHEPWHQVPVQVEVSERSLLERNWPFFSDAVLLAGNFSPGAHNVWMGWPHAADSLEG